MDDDVLHEKIESIRLSLARIKSKQPFSADELATNFDLQDIVSVNLQRAIQSCVDIATHILASNDAPAPRSMADSFDALVSAGRLSPELGKSLRRAIAFRKVLVHQYKTVDWRRVQGSLEKGTGELVAFCRQIETSGANPTG